MHNGANPQPRPRVTSRAEAERLLEIVLAAIAALETTLADESSHLRLGRIAAGLASGARKSELTATYLQSLEAVKANAIALARFAPEAVAR